jgi:hypothetical protein
MGLLNDVAELKDTANGIASTLETNRTLRATQATGLQTTNERLTSIEMTLNGGSGIGAGGPWEKEGLVHKVDQITALLTGFKRTLTWVVRTAFGAIVVGCIGAWLVHLGVIAKAASLH